jgi:hypothetical protein
MPFISSLDRNVPANTEEARLGAQRIREIVAALADTHTVEHHNDSGIHKFPIKTETFFTGVNDKDGRLAVHGNDLAPKVFLGSALPYAGAGNATFTNGNANVTGSGTNWLSVLRPGMKIKATSHGDASYTEIARVVSDTAITLTQGYLGASESAVAWTAELLPSGWLPIGTTRFSNEHNPSGTHKIPVRTDGADPPKVENGNFWFDAAGGANRIKFRDAGTTKTAGHVFVWLTSPTAKVSRTDDSVSVAFTTVALSGSDLVNTGHAPHTAILQCRLILTGATGAVGGWSLKLRKTGSGLDTPNCPTLSVFGEMPSVAGVGSPRASGLFFVPLDSSLRFDFALDKDAEALRVSTEVRLLGYVM